MIRKFLLPALLLAAFFAAPAQADMVVRVAPPGVYVYDGWYRYETPPYYREHHQHHHRAWRHERRHDRWEDRHERRHERREERRDDRHHHGRHY